MHFSSFINRPFSHAFLTTYRKHYLKLAIKPDLHNKCTEGKHVFNRSLCCTSTLFKDVNEKHAGLCHGCILNIFQIQQHIQMIMLVPSKHNINLWRMLMSSMTATAPFRVLNEVCRFKCTGDGFDNNLIEMSTTKMKRQDKLLSLFNQTLKTVLPPYLITQSDDFRVAEISAHVTEGML